MRYLAPTFGLLLGSVVSLAFAQMVLQTFALDVPPGANPLAGARPGNEIGTGSSLPMSDKANNFTPSDTRSVFAPNLPSPSIGENAATRDYRVDRSVPLFQTSAPIDDPLVAEIEDALHTLSTDDRLRAMQIIEASIARIDAAAAR